MKRERRPEDQFFDQVVKAIAALPGVLFVDMRHVGVFEKVLPKGKRGGPVHIGRKGQPDLLVIVDGKALGVELKSDAAHGRFAGDVDRLLPGQVTCHAAWAAMGTPVVVCRSVEGVLSAIEARRQA